MIAFPNDLKRQRGPRARLGSLLAVACLLGSCQERQSSEHSAPSSTVPVAASTLSEGAVPVPERDVNLRQAQLELDRALALPELPGAPGFDKMRAQLVARAKSEPILLVRTPEFEKTKRRELLLERSRILEARPAWRALERLRKKFERRPEALRAVLLREGYLYSESVDLAFALVSQVRPEELFQDATLWIQRGQTTLRAHRNGNRGYVYDDGPEAGARVKLLHLDRVGSGEPQAVSLHRDIRALRYELFFDEVRIRRLTDPLIVADLRYGDSWVPSVLESHGAHLELKAELIADELAPHIAQVRAATRSKLGSIAQLQTAMLTQIEEALPFDEPKTEVGQEDGKLRGEWVRAYRSGADKYEYNGDSYNVFDDRGQPRVPQVCIDFILDTFERASGSWWLPKRSGRRERSEGVFRFSSLVPSSDLLRQTSTFVKLAESQPDAFDVLHFPERIRIELGHKERLFHWLLKHVSDFEVGDIILIRGFTPWDEEEEHTHAFFVYETDPMTGIPIAIAGNAGPANLWSWETEARRTPHRTIRTRIRPQAAWLQKIIPPGEGHLLPPPLIAGPR